MREVCQHLPPGADVTAREILAIAGELLREDDVVPVLSNDGVAYTTVDMLAVERAALDAVTARVAEHLAVVEGLIVDTALASAQLRPDQVALVRDIALSGRGVEIITGPAGSGKTRALATAVASWTSTGVDVHGVAVAAITADGLRAATGASSTSLARLLSHPEQHLPTDGVLLLHEAGMVGTRQLAGVIELTRRMRCKLVLVGDPAQLPEMEAGGLFAALSRRAAAIHLEGHHRQAEPWEVDALAAVRAGQTSAAFDAYAEHGRLHTDESSESLRTSWSPTTSCTGQRSTTRVRCSSWLAPARRPTDSTTSCVLGSSPRGACPRHRCGCRPIVARSTSGPATRSS